MAGEVDFGDRASLEGNLASSRFELERRWFDRWLKGIANGAEGDPPVRYFTMGGGSGGRTSEGRYAHGGTWQASQTWPPLHIRDAAFYLQPDGGLSETPPVSGAARSDYVYDPRNPVPTLGGNMIRYGNILWPGAYDQVERPDFFLCNPPYLPLATRPDVLVFRTDALPEEIELTGAVTARLYISSSALDTDFTAKLIDEVPPSEEYPRGFAMNLTHGICRCRYRNSREKAELMTPGCVYAIDITCYPTSNRFAKGHRIRLDISSSNFPHFDLNTNTGDAFGKSQRMAVAHNRVFHSSEYPSHIRVPIAEVRG